MMKKSIVSKRIKLIVSFVAFSFFSFQSFAVERTMTYEEKSGKKFFEGSLSFQNGGPSCITCHNVNAKNMISGGLYAKDLTDVYARLGEGISGWLISSPFPAMEVSFQNNPLTTEERENLQAFFKYVHEVNENQEVPPPTDYMLYGGIGGVVTLFFLIHIIWFSRKKKMVKREVFDRQIRARDAKY